MTRGRTGSRWLRPMKLLDSTFTVGGCYLVPLKTVPAQGAEGGFTYTVLGSGTVLASQSTPRNVTTGETAGRDDGLGQMAGCRQGRDSGCKPALSSPVELGSLL